MDKQSVRISVDKFYYAALSSDTEEGVSYETPVYLPGVNYVALRMNSSIGTFYSDEGVFETYVHESDRDMQVSFAGLSIEVIAELTGASYKNGLLEDKKDDIPPYVAVGFRTQKSDASFRYVWLYKGRFAKSDVDVYSKSISLSPQSDVYIFKAINRVWDGAWRRMIDSDDSDMPVFWFGNPNYIPSAT